MKKWLKECPFCANEIEENVVICPYCDEFLDWKKDNRRMKNSSTVDKNPIWYVTFGRRFRTWVLDLTINSTWIWFIINIIYALVTWKTVWFGVMWSKIVRLDWGKPTLLQKLSRFVLYRPNIFTLLFTISFWLVYINAIWVIPYLIWVIPVVMIFNFVERIVWLGASSIFESRIWIKRIQYAHAKYRLLILIIIIISYIMKSVYEMAEEYIYLTSLVNN